MDKKETKPEKKQSNPGEASWLEWICAGLGLVIVLGVIGFLIYRGANDADAPPQVKIEVEQIRQAGEHYLVNFRVTNTGGMTAAALTIEGELKNGEETEETSDMTLTYLPANSVRHAGIFFTKNPNEFQLRLRAKGYEKP